MIKVNLLSPEKKDLGGGGQAISMVEETKESKVHVGAAVGALVLTAVVIGYLYISQKSAFDRARDTVREKQARKADLVKVLKTVEQLEATKAKLDRKVKIIQQLKGRQQSAVRMMDEVSKALPDNVWLTKLTLKGTVVNLEGRASTNDLVADFIHNLIASNFFHSEKFNGSTRGKAAGADIFNFKLSILFSEDVLKQKEM
ncbi:MAG: PilN domain-containing protein [Candidatus Aminicenantes bacterium]|nr:PilN domain-containing protein [Candidatus Aminicenantes bacterium]